MNLKRILEEADYDIDGLAIVWGIPKSVVRQWFTEPERAPKWVTAYMSMVLALQKIGRVCYGEVGNPYD